MEFFLNYAGDFLHEADGIQGCLDYGGQTRGHLYLQVWYTALRKRDGKKNMKEGRAICMIFSVLRIRDPTPF
jgi:hypothetical protein